MRELARQPDLHRLGRRVGLDPGQAIGAARARRDVHDRAAATLDHPGDHSAERVDGPQHVDPHQALRLLGGQVGEGAVAPDAGVGHEDVCRPEVVLEDPDGRREGVGIGDVGGGDGAATAAVGEHVAEVGVGAGDQADPRPLPGGGHRHRPADAA